MRRLRLALTALALAAWGGSTFAKPQGKYCGTALSAGQTVEIVTDFFMGTDGTLGGHYEFADQGKDMPGSLSKGEITSENTWRFVWTDTYGTGFVDMIFSANETRFQGLWGANDMKPIWFWNGGPCDLKLS